jgi:hypothetical protein
LPSGRDQNDFKFSLRLAGVVGVRLIVSYPWRRLAYFAFS